MEVLRGVRHVVTFDGDTLPSMLNIVGATAQMVTHAKTLANLSALSQANSFNPGLMVANILMSRYITGFTYSNMKTVTTVDERRPVQSQIETGILRVSNDRTHLEGMWNVTGRGEIETGTLTTTAPKHTIDTHTETSGYSISLSPAALLSAYLNPALLTITACLPNVSVVNQSGTSSQTTHTPMTMNANDLFIRCNDAVFSGSTIHAKTLEALITGDLTIESLADMFQSESTNSNFGIALSGIASLMQTIPSDVSGTFQDPRLKAIPSIRIADEEVLSLKVRQLASLVGTERFYLTVGKTLYKKSAEVGLKPDGVVTRTADERIQAGRVLEEKVQEIESHKRSVFNPSIAEFVSMMSNIAELNKLNETLAEIERQQILANVPKEERKENSKKAKEFLEKPEVKEELAKKEVAEKKIEKIDRELAEMEAENPELATKFDELALKGELPTTRPTEENVDLVTLFEYSKMRQERSSAMKTVYQTIASFTEKVDAIGETNPKLAEYMGKALEGGGYLMTALPFGRAAKYGTIAVIKVGSKMGISDLILSALIEDGGKALIENAASYGDTQLEAEQLAYGMARGIDLFMKGVTVVGITSSLKNAGTLKTKVSTVISGAKTIGHTVFQKFKVARERFGLAQGQQLVEATNPAPYNTLFIQMIKDGRILAKPEMVKHHIFNVFRGDSPSSQKYRDFFATHGIDIDGFTVLIPKTMHVDKIHGAGNNWTTKWKQWIDINPKATTKEVYQFAGTLMDEYGISHVPIVGYKK